MTFNTMLNLGKYKWIGGIVLIIPLIVLTNAVLDSRPKKMENLYDHRTPACIPTKGKIAKPGRAINPWPWVHDDGAFDLLSDLRVEWIRYEFLWARIEPKQGAFSWDESDRIVRDARAHNIQILGLLDYSAPWANKHKKEYYPPTDIEDYTNFVAEVVQRYKPNGVFAKSEGWIDGYGVTHWEIWNEQNGQWFWLPLPNVADYVEMLHQANRAIRTIDEKAVILHGGLDPAGKDDDPKLTLSGFLGSMYMRGAKDCFDVVNVHPYFFSDTSPTELDKGYLKAVKETMVKYGDGKKPIWLTEFGYVTGPGGWTNEAHQAEFLKEAYGELSKGSFQALFWFALGDGSDPASEYFGLMRADRSRKPAYQAYRDLPF